MVRARRFSPLTGLLALAVFGLALDETRAVAQQRAGAAQKPGSPGAAIQRTTPATTGVIPPGPQATVNLKDPAQFRVYQRDINDKADIPIVLDDFDKEGSTLVSATLTPNPGNIKTTFNKAESKLVGVPVGGPYTIL